MALKYYDSIKGWEERGYKVTAQALKQPLNEAMVNRKGERVYSWGQVVPADSRDYTENASEDQVG